MAAEIRLNVALDLAYFRQQLPKLTQAAAGYRLPLQVKFDARQIRLELNKLTGRREFRINLNDTAIKSALENTKKLQTELAKLEQIKSGAAAAGASRPTRTFRQRLEATDKAELAKLYKATAAAGLTAFDEGIANNKAKLVTRLNQIGEDAVAGLLNGFKSKNAAVANAAKELGETSIKAIKQSLGIASPSREFKKVGEDSGEGLEKGLKEGIGEAARVGVQEIRSLFRALQGEAQAGTARLQAMMMGAMAGVVQLPGGRQQRGRLTQTGVGINAAMTGPALGNIQTRQRAVRGGAQGAAATTPAFAAALPLMFGMDPRELTARLQGLYGQQYQAPSMGGYQTARPRRVDSLIAALASARGNLSPAAGVNQRLFTGGAVNPGVLPSGYIGRSAISPGFVNYPPGMPSAYGTGFIGRPGGGQYGMARAPMQGPALPVRGIFDSTPAPRQIAGLLGPAGTAEATKAAAQALRVLEAEARSAARSASVFAEDAARASRRRGMEVASGQVPLGGGVGMLPPGRGGGSGGRGGFGGIGPNFGRDFGRGLVGGGGGGIAGEIASEFGNATKQVLLFGTAYKALAAITSLPGNIAQATASLQSFRNQLEAVTGGGEIMANSMSLIEDTVARFNVPVQSARDGFVKLYASMQPAGIDLSTINNVFTGLSAAASTFGMSADQVDRMTYALAQMASKGQIMTEELKGQLGDVFPQAVSLFAEAAGFLDESMDEQAKSKGLSSFLEALEDGALKGEAMSKVLANVGGLLNTKFGPTAEKAAGSFQNQMTKLNNALNDFYESFEPAAGAFLGEFVTPMVQALATLGDAVKLALSDEPIQNNELAGYLRDELFPQLLNVKDALLAGAQQLGAFAQAVGVVLRPLAQFVLGNQQAVSILVRGVTVLGLFRVAAAAVNATGIIPLIRNIIRYNGVFRLFLVQTASGTKGMTALRTAAVQTGMSMRQAATGVRVLATAIRTALVSVAIGVALVAIGALIEKIMELQAVAEGIERQRGGAGTRIRKAAEMGGTEAMQQEQRRVQGEIKSRRSSIAILEKLQSGKTITGAERDQLKATGSLPSGLTGAQGGFTAATTQYAGGGGFETRIAGDVGTVLERNKKSLAAFTEGLDKQTQAAIKNAAVVDKRFKDQSTIQDIDLTGGGDGTGGKGGKGGGKTTPAQLLDLTKQLNQAKEEGRRLDEIALQYQIDVLNANQEQEDEIGRLISLEEARHRQAEALADLGEEIGKEMAQQYLEAEEQRKREYEGRKQINRLMVETRFAAGEITQKEKDRLLFLQGQIDALDQLRETPGVTEEDITAFQAAQANIPEPGSIGEAYQQMGRELDNLTDRTTLLKTAATGIGDAFGQVFTDIATGAQTWQEALGGAFRSVASMFADMVAQMLAKWAAMQVLQMFLPGSGSSIVQGVDVPVAQMPAGMAFANGGIVTGPTLGLVGEGRFNEAVVPLPNGKSIPVELGDGAGSNISTNIVVNVNNGQASSQVNGAGGQNLGREIETAVRGVILKETRPGGIIYNAR